MGLIHRGRHRAPRRHVRDLLYRMWLLTSVRPRLHRRWAPEEDWSASRARPAEIQRAGLSIADVIAAAATSYPVVEPCPWGLSAGACAIWHPSDHKSKYVTGAGAPVA
jgi:hypothetical protein